MELFFSIDCFFFLLFLVYFLFRFLLLLSAISRLLFLFLLFLSIKIIISLFDNNFIVMKMNVDDKVLHDLACLRKRSASVFMLIYLEFELGKEG